MRASVVAGSLALALASADLLAGQQICGSQMVPPTVRTCPDGSLPAFIAEEVQPQRSHERIGRDPDWVLMRNATRIVAAIEEFLASR